MYSVAGPPLVRANPSPFKPVHWQAQAARLSSFSSSGRNDTNPRAARRLTHYFGSFESAPLPKSSISARNNNGFIQFN